MARMDEGRGAFKTLTGTNKGKRPRDPRYASSNLAEEIDYFQVAKIMSTSPPGGTLSRGSRV